MSPSSLMAGMLYTRRLRKKNPSYLHQVSSSDLFLISMVNAPHKACFLNIDLIFTAFPLDETSIIITLDFISQ